MPRWYDEIAAALAGHGLIARGAFHPEPADGAPPETGTLLLAGNAGPAMWRAFTTARPTGPDPLDSWCSAALTAVAARFAAVLLLPSDGPPYHPFQRWAMRAGNVFRSPLGILIDPEYGLWHGYRGAFAFADRRDLPPRRARDNPCDGCAGRPCLSACPVAAFGADGYDVPACAAHLASAAGVDCMTGGCGARRACPVGRDHVFAPAQAEFHMRAFLAARN
ncbi:MAG: ferredoxin [Rhodospirillales bacterium]|nr:MAG: ferredoxin [Rhodospirillales bacterium]